MNNINARVYDNAVVYGNAWVYDNAWVSDDARVYDNARVSDNAVVRGNARVYDDASVVDNAVVYGNAWVFDNAWVCGDAQVYGNAVVRGDALIESTADYLTVGPALSALSSGRFVTAHKDAVIGVRVNTGCFTGTLQEFRDAIERTHANNPAALRQYMLFHKMFADYFSAESESK